MRGKFETLEMKKITLLYLFIICGISLTLNAQHTSSKNGAEIITGYGANTLGKYAHIVGGYHFNSTLIYGGVRIQENSPYNFLFPNDGAVYRGDESGTPLGLIVGFQQNLPIPSWSITPFFFADFEYAYLRSEEKDLYINIQQGTEEFQTSYISGRSLYLPGFGIGFEARIWKDLYLKQVLGANALFDTQYYDHHFPEFNGIGATLRFSLLYKF